jgi:hypothetical protein
MLRNRVVSAIGIPAPIARQHQLHRRAFTFAGEAFKKPHLHSFPAMRFQRCPRRGVAFARCRLVIRKIIHTRSLPFDLNCAVTDAAIAEGTDHSKALHQVKYAPLSPLSSADRRNSGLVKCFGDAVSGFDSSSRDRVNHWLD